MTDTAAKKPRDKMPFLAFGLMTVTGVIGFVLSYEALWSLADAHGKDGWRGGVWPLVIDLPIVAFSLAGVIAARRQVSAILPRLVVAGATLATVAYNWYHAYDNAKDFSYNVIAVTVAISAPVLYFWSFEIALWLIGVLRDNPMTQHSADVTEPTTQPDATNTPVSQPSDTPMTVAPEPVTDVTATDDSLQTEIDKLLAMPKRQQSQYRRALIGRHHQRHTPPQWAKLCRVGARTIARDLAALNGDIKSGI